MKSWLIEVKDTGEKIVMTCGEHRVVEKYNPEKSQYLPHSDRDEAIGAAWAAMSELFDKEDSSG